MSENKQPIIETSTEVSATEAQLLTAMTQPLPESDYQVSLGEPLADGTTKATKEEIIEALKTVSDPEIMINIWDLGLVYDVRQQDNGDVEIDMTVTAPTCPVAGILPAQAAEALSNLQGVGVATVKLVWEPAWTIDRLSDDAKMLIQLF